MWLGLCTQKSFCRYLLYIIIISQFVYKVYPTPVHESSPSVNATNEMTESFPNHKDRLIRIPTMAVDAIGAILNTLLILAFIVDPLKVLRKGAWVIILNLAVADLIACVSNFLDVGLISVFDVIDSMTMKVVRFILLFGVSASIMLLTLLTMATYVVTKYPIKGRIILTAKKTVIFCMIAWLLAIPFGLSNIAYHFTTRSRQLMKIYVVQIAILELAVVIQVILKIMIIHEIMKSRRNSVNTEQQNNRHKEVAKTIIILNVILVVTVLPFFVSKQLEFLWNLELIDGDRLIRKFSDYYEPVVAVNYVSNPILYAWRLPDYRRTLVSPFKRCRSKGLFKLRCLRCCSKKATVIANRAISLPALPQRNTTTKL